MQIQNFFRETRRLGFASEIRKSLLYVFIIPNHTKDTRHCSLFLVQKVPEIMSTT